MSEMMLPLILASAIVLVTAMVCLSALRAWRGWLELKRLQLGAKPAAASRCGSGATSSTASISPSWRFCSRGPRSIGHPPVCSIQRAGCSIDLGANAAS